MKFYAEFTYAIDSHTLGLGENALRNASELPKLDDVKTLPDGQVVVFSDYDNQVVVGVRVEASFPTAARIEAEERAKSHLTKLMHQFGGSRSKPPAPVVVQVFNPKGAVVLHTQNGAKK